MAGKKSSGVHKTSKGERRNVSVQNSGKSERRNRSPLDDALNKQKALAKGKTVVFTIENPDPKQTNKRFIKKVVKPVKRKMYVEGPSKDSAVT